MAISLHCDRCKRFIQVVSNFDNSMLKKEIVCKLCTASEEELKTGIERLKVKWQTSLTKLQEEARSELLSFLGQVKSNYDRKTGD